ncbi:MAG: tyrosine-type recombinase/integrase, partial [Ignavibacteriales bacterium]
ECCLRVSGKALAEGSKGKTFNKRGYVIMGSVFLRGDSWVGEYKDRGKIKRITFGKKGVVTKTLAKEMLRKIEQRVKLGQYDMLDAQIPILKEFAKAYIEYQRDVKQIRSPGRSRIALNNFATLYGDKRLKDISAEDIDIYKQRRLGKGAKPGTIRRELCVVKALFNQAKKWKKFFGENPVSQAGMPEVHNQRERVLTPEEENRLIDASPEPLKCVIVIALNTGMRLGEILGLKWEWIDLKDNYINLPHTHTKANESRKVPANPVVRKLLLERKLESGGSEFVFPRMHKDELRGKIQRTFKTACQIARIDNLRFHDLRHTAGTRLGESGVPIQTIAKLLGHATTRMTERYVHPSDSVKEATDILAHFSKRVTDNSTDTNERQ